MLIIIYPCIYYIIDFTHTILLMSETTSTNYFVFLNGWHAGGEIYSGHSPPWEGGNFLSKLKNREEFEGGLEKKKGKGGKKEKKKRVIKHTLKYLYEA